VLIWCALSLFRPGRPDIRVVHRSATEPPLIRYRTRPSDLSVPLRSRQDVPVTQSRAKVSQREAEVLAALGEHLSNTQIASRLHLSVRTVETHVSSLLRKLGATDRRGLAALAPTLTGQSAPAAGAGPVPGLPASWTPFIGRTHERDHLRYALGESRLVTLLGPGGVGKTRLAALVAEELGAVLPLGAAFVELVSVRPGFLVQAVAAVLGVTEEPSRPLLAVVLDRLRHGRGLLVLDNCEHLIDDTAEFITALLGATDELTVLTTSRERIGVAGERVIPLPGLSLVAASSGGAVGSEAVSMFFDRARAVDPQFDANPADVGELCAQLDGMPLAIELATARTSTLGVAGLRAGLDDRLRLLTGGRDADRRHRSLRAVIDWSHDLLDDEERVAFRRLGRFVGDFDLAAAATVTEIPLSTLSDLVGRLADKSLLVHRRSSLGTWGLLETVRAYSVEKLTEAGERDQVLERHLRWAVERATGLEERLGSDDSWRAGFDMVVSDLRSALLTATDDAMAHRLARALGHLTYARRFLAESREHYLTAAARAPDDRDAAQDVWTAAHVAHTESRGELRFELSVEAADRAAAAGDRATQASVLAEAVSVGTRFPAIFETEVPQARLLELLSLADRVAPAGDRAVEAQLALAHAWHGTRAVDLPDVGAFERALEIARRADDPVLTSAAFDALCSVAVMSGRLRTEYELGQQRLALLDRLPGHQPHAGAEALDVLHMAVENAFTAGELPAAVGSCRMFSEDDMTAATPHMVSSKPIMALTLMGRFDEALEHAERTMAIWERAGCPSARWMAPPIYAAGMCHGLRGHAAEFDAWRALARDRVAGLQTRTMHFQLQWFGAFADARVALHLGDLDEAVRATVDLPTDEGAWWATRHWPYDAYYWAIAAEVAVAADRPDADRRLAAAQPVGEQNLWAAACLARARARRSDDPADFAESLAGWERIEARLERAVTLLLMPDRAAEGRAELAELGCPG
jgi:predicted ATPase/DNA-binding CsgD family transcriptional regulator